MGTTQEPKPVAFFIGLLARDQVCLDHALGVLKKEFGEFSCQMPPLSFRWTNYYEDEIGSSPLKCFVALPSLQHRSDIVDLKLKTNELELSLFPEGIRHVNLDPGYLTPGQMHLASTKDQRQRVYIRDGIFVEPTLYFRKGNWEWFDWTYPDYHCSEYHQFFTELRQILQKEIRQSRESQ